MDSILTLVKKDVGVMPDCADFDDELIMYTNDAIIDVIQAGVGPKEGFVVTSDADTWTDFLGTSKMLESAKTYICAQVKLAFDTQIAPSYAAVLQARADKCLWRLNHQAETEV